MNATAFDGGKVHLLTERAARCGVGKNGQRHQWQLDLGGVTCRRCQKIEQRQGQVTTETVSSRSVMMSLLTSAAAIEMRTPHPGPLPIAPQTPQRGEGGKSS